MLEKITFKDREFNKSSFSGSGHSCVGVSIQNDNIAVMNTITQKEMVTFTHEEWQAFIQGVKNNEFDL
jgi:hypothetical protein